VLRALVAIAALSSVTAAPERRMAIVQPDARAEVDVADAIAHGFEWWVGLTPVPAKSLGSAAWIAGCREELGCLARGFAERGVDLGVIVSADTAVAPPRVSLRVIDAVAVEELAKAAFDLRPNGPGIAGELSTELARIFEKHGHQLGGRVVVETDPPDAAVALAEARPVSAAEPHRFQVAPGEYPVLASLDGHRDAKAKVTVSAGETSTLRLHLDPAESVLSSWWFWTAVGLVVAGGVAAGVVAARPSGPYVICQRDDPSVPCR
jgi:hypothetical protein